MKPCLFFPVGKMRKRRRLAAFAAAILLLLSACARTPSSVSASNPRPRRTVDHAYAVHTDVERGVARTEGGAVLATYNYQIPVMVPLREDGSSVTEADARTEREKQALASAEIFNEEFVKWAEEADFPALEAAARQDYQWRYQEGEPWDIEYYQGLDCGVYQTDSLVSVRGLFYSYYGGVHPNTVCLGWNYDLISGRFVSAEQLFDDVESVTAELVRQARERASGAGLAPEEYFWSDYAEILSAWSDSTVAVTFNQEDMTVSYSPYDLAAYAVGEQIFTISRTWLEPYLNEYGRTLLA